MKKLLSVALILILAAGSHIGCKKDKGDPPSLPPAESMSIDFSNFISSKKSSSDTKGTENSNFEFAATVAGVWNVLLASQLAVPVASFKVAVDQDPTFLSDKTWQWSYTVSVLGASYKARLTGQIGASDVIWKMYVSKEGTGGFAEFIWFEGTSKVDGTGGQWTLKQSAAVQEPFLQIDWTKSGTTIGSVKYTHIKNNDPFKTSYIEYGMTTSALNAYYTVHYFNEVKFSDVNIEWNTSTHNGRVKSIDYLGDSEWHCWNANKINDVCSSK